MILTNEQHNLMVLEQDLADARERITDLETELATSQAREAVWCKSWGSAAQRAQAASQERDAMRATLVAAGVPIANPTPVQVMRSTVGRLLKLVV